MHKHSTVVLVRTIIDFKIRSSSVTLVVHHVVCRVLKQRILEHTQNLDLTVITSYNFNK